jgi:hypothetical protein
MAQGAERQVRASINYAGQIEGRARFDVADMSRTNIAFEPVYHQEVAKLISQVTGADLVVPQRTGLLVRRGERSKEPTWAKPARFAHLDYTDRSVGDFLGWIRDWEGVDPGPCSRIAIYQTWRATSPPPQDNTLALGDASSFSPQDTRVFDAVLADGGAPGDMFESRLVLARPGQRWLYYPSLRDDELVVFKAWDSDPGRPRDVPHTAIDDPDAGPDAHPRESLEARFFTWFR